MNTMNLNTALAEYTSATQLAVTYEDSSRKMIEALETLGREARVLAEAFHDSYGFSPCLDFNGSRHQLDADGKTEEYFRLWIKQRAWAALIEKLGITNLMSSARQDELRHALHGQSREAMKAVKELPEISETTIMEVIQGYIGAADGFIEELVRETFDWLLPWRNEYKTNSTWKVNKKVIKGYVVDAKWSGGYHVNYAAQSKVVSLDNVFHILDGKGVLKGYKGPLSDAINATTDDVSTGETEYFGFKCFRNGNLHLKFLRDDLLEKFNTMGGRNRLPKGENA